METSWSQRDLLRLRSRAGLKQTPFFSHQSWLSPSFSRYYILQILYLLFLQVILCQRCGSEAALEEAEGEGKKKDRERGTRPLQEHTAETI